MDAERIAVAKKVLEHNWRFNVPPAMQYLDASQYIESLEQQVESLKLSLSNNELQIGELRQRLSLREELAADPEMVAGMKRGLAYLRDYDKIVSELREPLWYAIEYIEELEQQLTYQTDRAESFCTRLHEEEHRNAELRQRCETMSAYPRTHDHRLHDEAMAAAREQLPKE